MIDFTKRNNYTKKAAGNNEEDLSMHSEIENPLNGHIITRNNMNNQTLKTTKKRHRPRHPQGDYGPHSSRNKSARYSEDQSHSPSYDLTSAMDTRECIDPVGAATYHSMYYYFTK